MHTVTITTPDVYSLKIASLQRLLLIVAQPVSFDSAMYHKSRLLVYLYVITLPPF